MGIDDRRILTLRGLRHRTRDLEINVIHGGNQELWGSVPQVFMGVTHTDLQFYVERLPGFVHVTERVEHIPMPYEFGVVEDVIFVLTPNWLPVAGGDNIYPLVIIEQAEYQNHVANNYLDVDGILDEDRQVNDDFIVR